MTVNLSPIGGAAAQFFDDNGDPLSGGKIYTYVAGTTTPQPSYTSISGSIPHTNPIILDAAGRVPGGEIWLTDGIQYKFVIKTSTDVQIGSYDNLSYVSLDAGEIIYDPPFTNSVPTTVEAKLAQTVSVKDFGAVGDGVANDTVAVQLANAASLTLLFPAGGTYNITNWVPLSGTKILAHGAILQREASTIYGVTGSSAAIILANNQVEIFGGKITVKPGVTNPTFSGCVLVDGGDNCGLHNVELTGAWTGIFGNATQNSGNVANNLTIDACWLHDNQHNTYLADIDGLIVSGSVFERADRDGLKTYRNAKNLTITGNIFRDNGDGTLGQSQNGLDLFIAGNTCIISDNLIYNNIYDKGIDIKRNASGSNEAVQNEKFIISNNLIHSNGSHGIEIEVANNVGYVDNIIITGNEIRNNAQRGVFGTYLRSSDISHNNIYDNLNDGIRLDNVDAVRVIGNHIKNNTGSGILGVSGTGVLITANDVIGSSNQTSGIFVGALTDSYCHDNNVRGHVTNYAVTTATIGVKGKTLDATITNTTATQFISVSSEGCVSAIETTLNGTATLDFTVSKRNATTGAALANITSNPALSLPTPFVTVNPTLSGTTSQRILEDNNAILVTLGNITSSFTTGYVRIHYID